MKVAVAIVVKDEAADILPWLCWYFRLNVDTIIVHDDSSTDGTFELVRDVAATRDIRLHRVPPSIEFYTHRQQRCYVRTLVDYADEFDWIGFFDADEYLSLPGDQDLSLFLDRPRGRRCRRHQLVQLWQQRPCAEAPHAAVLCLQPPLCAGQRHQSTRQVVRASKTMGRGLAQPAFLRSTATFVCRPRSAARWLGPPRPGSRKRLRRSKVAS